MNKTTAIVGIVVALVVGIYAGDVYGKNTVSAASQTAGAGFARGMGGFGGRMRGASGGFASGKIVSMDDKSITIALMNFGSSTSQTNMQTGTKIIFLSASTPIMKSVAGSLGDLVAGTNVVVSGTPNSDGSITAENIQIRNLPTR